MSIRDIMVSDEYTGKADLLTETPFQTARREAYEEIGLPLSDDRLPPGYSVEHLTELPANLAMTELGVRPCVAFLRSSSPKEQSTNTSNTSSRDHPPDPTRDLLPRLDAKEVAAVFTAPFSNFLHSEDEDPDIRRRVPGTWYKGSWHSWHEEAWRMHQFYVPVSRNSVFRGGSPPLADPPMNPSKDDAAHNEGKKNLTDPSTYGDKSSSDFSPPMPKPNDLANNEDALDQPRYRVFGMTARILVDAARVAYGEEPDFEHNSHFGDEDMIERLMRIGRMGPVKKQGERLTRDVMTKAAKI